MIITIAVPAAHVSDANDLAMVLGYGPPDELTYGETTWVDENGSLYSAASLTIEPTWINTATSPLERPVWDDEPYKVNMAGANRAQSIVNFWMPSEEQPEPPKADENYILAIAGYDGLDALAMMGLTRVE